MALSLRAAASLAAPPRGPRPGRRTASVVRATASPAALDNRNRRREQNVSGEFFVDHRCIDCATCRWMAPEVFKRVDGLSAVAAQPSSEEERTRALQALLSCPTASIHTDKPAKDILQVQNTFPLPIDDDLPGWPCSSSFFCRRPSIPAGVASVAQGRPLRLPASGRCDKIFDGRPKIFNGAAAPRRPAALSPSHDLRTAAEIGSSARHGGDPSHRITACIVKASR